MNCVNIGEFFSRYDIVFISALSYLLRWSDNSKNKVKKETVHNKIIRIIDSIFIIFTQLIFTFSQLIFIKTVSIIKRLCPIFTIIYFCKIFGANIHIILSCSIIFIKSSLIILFFKFNFNYKDNYWYILNQRRFKIIKTIILILFVFSIYYFNLSSLKYSVINKVFWVVKSKSIIRRLVTITIKFWLFKIFTLITFSW